MRTRYLSGFNKSCLLSKGLDQRFSNGGAVPPQPKQPCGFSLKWQGNTKGSNVITRIKRLPGTKSFLLLSDTHAGLQGVWESPRMPSQDFQSLRMLRRRRKSNCDPLLVFDRETRSELQSIFSTFQAFGSLRRHLQGSLQPPRGQHCYPQVETTTPLVPGS